MTEYRPSRLDPPEQLRRLQIEVTTYCNLFCQECSRTVGLNAGQWVDSHLSQAKFERLIEHSFPAEILVLQGIGEPTLNPDLIGMVRYAKESGRFKHLTLNTNAVTRTPEYFAELRDAGLSYVCVSVDSMNPIIAERCRSGTKLEKMKSMLWDIYRTYGVIVISMVASKLNWFDIPNTLAELDAMGRELFPGKQFTVEIQPVISYQADGSNAPTSTLNGRELALLRDILFRMRSEIPHIRLVLNTATIEEHDGVKRCARPVFSPYITVDGYMTPCCTTFDTSIYQHTNILFTPMEEAWVSPPVRDWLRNYLMNGDKMCEGCCFDIGGLLRRPEAAE